MFVMPIPLSQPSPPEYSRAYSGPLCTHSHCHCERSEAIQASRVFTGVLWATLGRCVLTAWERGQG
jgi:hypothetical protein